LLLQYRLLLGLLALQGLLLPLLVMQLLLSM
jgi:hypothetical protein